MLSHPSTRLNVFIFNLKYLMLPPLSHFNSILERCTQTNFFLYETLLFFFSILSSRLPLFIPDEASIGFLVESLKSFRLIASSLIVFPFSLIFLINLHLYHRNFRFPFLFASRGLFGFVSGSIMSYASWCRSNCLVCS